MKSVKVTRKVVEDELMLFDDVTEYLDWYAEQHGGPSFTRVGYNEWKFEQINGTLYYYHEYDKVVRLSATAYKQLLDMCKKEYRILERNVMNNCSCHTTGKYCSPDEAVVAANQKIIKPAVDRLREKIQDLQSTITALEGKDLYEHVEVEYILTHTNPKWTKEDN